MEFFAPAPKRCAVQVKQSPGPRGECQLYKEVKGGKSFKL